MPQYSVVPMFWGNTFPLPSDAPGSLVTRYEPQEFTEAIRYIISNGYFKRTKQYGVENILATVPFISNDWWPNVGDSNYVVYFTKNDISSFLTRHLNDVVFPTGTIPIYAIVIPNGSLVDRDTTKEGEHSVLEFQGQKNIWFWMYGSSSINSVCQLATHEIVEAIGANFGVPRELCDDCKTSNPNGRTLANGLTVETYYDAISNTCVALVNLGWFQLHPETVFDHTAQTVSADGGWA